MRAALEVMPPILLWGPTMSKVNGGEMAVEVESSHQHSITFCHETDGSRGGGSVTKWCLTWKCVWSKVVWLNSSLQKKKCTHGHLLPFAERLLRRSKSWCGHSEAVGGVFQQWWQQCERRATFWMAMYSCHTTTWSSSWSAHLYRQASGRVYVEK